MGKTWHFIANYREQTKRKFLATERNQNKNSLSRTRAQNKTKAKQKPGCLPQSAFFIAIQLGFIPYFKQGYMILSFSVIERELDDKIPETHDVIKPAKIKQERTYHETYIK